MPAFLKGLRLDEKRALLSLRFVVFLFLAFYAMYGPEAEDRASFAPFLPPALLLASILALIRLPAERFRDARLQVGLFLADVGLVTWSIHASGASGTDLYLVYFLVILMSGMQSRPAHAFLTGAAAAALYGFFWSRAHPEESLLSVQLALRFPFFFIMAFFSAFFAQQVRDREAKLRWTEEKLADSEKLALVGRLAGGMAQEVNNLLTVILGHCRLLLEDKPKSDPDREALESMARNAELIAQRIFQLLQYSQRHIAVPELVDLDCFLTERLSLLRQEAGEGVRLTLLLGKAEPVSADPKLLQQALLCLIANARDAMREGGALTLRTCRREGWTVLEVEDTGRGIPAEAMEHLFEPFFSTKADGMGTGLGLAGLYGFLKKSGGEVAVESRPGRGTTFELRFPALKRQAG